MQTVTDAVRPDLPLVRTPLPGPKAAAIIERDHAAVSPSYIRPYPLVAERAKGAIVEDPDGNRFLDFNAGIAVAAAGHCHPRVVEAIQKQSARLIHMSGTDFYYECMVDLAEKLAALAPGGGPRRVYFGNSGTEAIEAAMKLARYHTGREKFIAFYGCFHGRTMGSLSLTASKAVQRRGFGPLVPGVVHVPYPDPYRRGAEASAAESIAAIERAFKTVAPPDEVAAIFVEPVLGEGGYVIPPKKFFNDLQALARAHGILIVADEVQSGMGRTGRMFACEHFGFVPDIIAVAKGIASGMPISAIITRADVMNWGPGAHASTFGGNPVACAAAMATIELLESGLMENARNVGDHIMSRLKRWPGRFPNVGEARGLGLMIGIEIVADRASREKAPDLRNRIVRMAFERGVLVLGAGESALRLSPPLVITKEQADFALDTLEQCIPSAAEASPATAA